MTNLDIKTLAQIIAVNGLDVKTASTILKTFKRSDQKSLIQKLKIEIQKNKIIVTSAQKIDPKTQKSLMNIFGKQKINTFENTNLGAGLIIQDNDTIYDMSFKGRLNNTFSEITELI